MVFLWFSHGFDPEIWPQSPPETAGSLEQVDTRPAVIGASAKEQTSDLKVASCGKDQVGNIWIAHGSIIYIYIHNHI